MASNTPNLNLLKKDPVTDGNDTFNIQTMLNDNWDKIDEAIGDVREELQDINIPPASLTEAGIVRLSNSTSGTREDAAATELAVKTTYDAAAAAQTTANAANLAAAAAQAKADAAMTLLADLPRYAVDLGTANAKVVNFTSNVPTSYFEGMAIAFKNKVQNTGAVTINVNGLGTKSILKSNGSTLASGNLKADSIYTIRYNGTNFILQGEGGEYGTATAADVRSTKTIGTDAGLVSGSLVTRASSALTITPTTSDQVFQPGIYDGTITVKGANVRTTPDLSWLIGAFPSKQDALGQNYVDGRPYIDSQGNVYSGTISSVTAAHIQKRDRLGTLLSNVQVGNSGVTYITGKTVACRHGVYIYSVSSNTYRNFYDYSGNLLKANPTGHLGIAVRPVDIEWKSNKLYTFARSIGTTAHVLENDTILFTFPGSAYDYDSDIWILGVSEDMKLVGGDLGINLLYYNGSSWNRAFTIQKTVDSIMPFTFLVSALLQAPAS